MYKKERVDTTIIRTVKYHCKIPSDCHFERLVRRKVFLEVKAESS